MENLHINMIINRKKKHKKTEHIIKDILGILEKYKVKVELDDDFNNILDTFLLNYIKLSKLLEIKKDEIDNEHIVKNLVDSIITKVENNDFLIPDLNLKKIQIEEKCKKHYEKNSDITIVMK